MSVIGRLIDGMIDELLRGAETCRLRVGNTTINVGREPGGYLVTVDGVRWVSKGYGWRPVGDSPVD